MGIFCGFPNLLCNRAAYFADITQPYFVAHIILIFHHVTAIPYHIMRLFLTCILQCRDYTRAQNVWSGWPAYEVKCLCSIGRD